MNLVLLGAPGAGKGTQAEVISNRLSIPIISTGAILREAVAAGTPLGVQAKTCMDAGELVPDELIISIIKQRLTAEDCSHGFILDGVPRNVSQADALKEMGVAVDAVIDIDVPDADIIARLSGRRVCGKCSAPYHLINKPPVVEGVCDVCGAPLVARADDSEATVSERLRVYHKNTEPLIDYYQKQGKLFVVDGSQSIQETTRLVFAVIEALS